MPPSLPSSKTKSKKARISTKHIEKDVDNVKEGVEEYNRQVRRFFQAKQEWETRKTKRQSKCPICNNITSKMRFEISQDLYLAKCGKTDCSLEIARRVYISQEDKMAQMEAKLAHLKNRFIIQKMDAMFKYIDDKNAIKVFKDEFEEYRELLKVYNQYNGEFANQETETAIETLNTQIYKECQEIKQLEETVKTSGTTQSTKLATNTATKVAITDIIDIVHNKLEPLVAELQQKQYPIMEMNLTKDGHIKLYQKPQLPKFILTN
jgi:paraquat-inducible protein B